MNVTSSSSMITGSRPAVSSARRCRIFATVAMSASPAMATRTYPGWYRSRMVSVSDMAAHRLSAADDPSRAGWDGMARDEAMEAAAGGIRV
jgi:NAD(P)-dependent dehydrogenase (short-subunit alcohol dehydrogenase family)